MHKLWHRLGDLAARSLRQQRSAKEAAAKVATGIATEETFASNLDAHDAGTMDAALSCAVIMHHLQLFGIRDGSLLVLGGARVQHVAEARTALALGRTIVVIAPDQKFCTAFGVSLVQEAAPPPQVFTAAVSSGKAWERLRTLHAAHAFVHPAGVPVVFSKAGSAVWLWCLQERGGILFVGTALPADLVRYRQGDPLQAKTPPAEALWGIAGERPLYLFEAQLSGEGADERHADWWAMTLVEALRRHAGIVQEPMLPGGAPGAIVVTGDDDQAALANYEAQLHALGEVPITYFLHPKTKHDAISMARLFAGRRVDLGLHPDALDAPERYDDLFDEQAQWFQDLCGFAPKSVRNHGFLNRGYWGHLPAWLRADVRLSSNLPGLDGRVLNGSLLPARLLWNDTLTEHWSILTAIGDGVVFALGMAPQESAQCILDLAERIRASGVPGVIVLNLHPDNIARTTEMHRAACEVVRGGFVAWTVQDCHDWFANR